MISKYFRPEGRDCNANTKADSNTQTTSALENVHSEFQKEIFTTEVAGAGGGGDSKNISQEETEGEKLHTEQQAEFPGLERKLSGKRSQRVEHCQEAEGRPGQSE